MVSSKIIKGVSMKLNMFLLAFGLIGSSSVFARTWIAICNNSKNIQYNQTEMELVFFT